MNLRLTILAVAMLAAAPIALAATPREMLNLLAQCAEAKDSIERLACFDKLAPQLRETVAAMKKPSERTEEDRISLFGFDFGGVFGSREGPTTPEEFGKAQVRAPEEEVEILESITAGVTEYAMTPFGKFIVFLDNGQVWRQLDADTGVARFLKPASRNKVIISRGLLGSYNLKINDQNLIFKARRVK
ncbi:MAG: hypothetical protein ACT4OG_03065 [Alphaproteobacteria bacterium]